MTFKASRNRISLSGVQLFRSEETGICIFYLSVARDLEDVCLKCSFFKAISFSPQDYSETFPFIMYQSVVENHCRFTEVEKSE